MPSHWTALPMGVLRSVLVVLVVVSTVLAPATAVVGAEQPRKEAVAGAQGNGLGPDGPSRLTAGGTGDAAAGRPVATAGGSDTDPTVTVLNPQSYPSQGGNWSVSIETDGTATLTIEPANGTTWSRDGNGTDLEFLELTTDDGPVAYEWRNGTVVVENFSAGSVAVETVRVRTPGEHHLRFGFGDDVAYASNDATPTPLVHYTFDEDPTNTSEPSVGNVTTRFQMFDDADQSANFHSTDGKGVSGDSGDRAFNATAAIEMGGDGPYLDLEQDQDELDTLYSFTVVGWFNRSPGTTGIKQANLLSKTDGSSGFKLQGDSSGDGLILRVDGQEVSDDDFLAGRTGWVFFAVTYDGHDGTVRFYRGNRSATVSEVHATTVSTTGRTADTTRPLVSSGDPGGSKGSAFKGYLDELRLFGDQSTNVSALNQSQLETLRNADLGDSTPPTVTSITTLDRDGDGRVDGANVVFDEAVNDSSITPSDWAIGGQAAEVVNTTVGGDSDADDEKVQLRITTGANEVNGTDAKDVTYAQGTTADLAGNLLADVASGDVSEGDGAAPVLTSAEETATGPSELTVTFSETVWNETGRTGALSPADFDFTDASGGGVSIDSVNHTAGDARATVTLDGAAETGSDELAAAATEVFDGADNAAGTKAVTVTESGAPSITEMTGPANGTYAIGQTLTFSVSYDESVTVNTTNGTPSVDLVVGGTARSASFAGGSGTRTLTFEYVVKSGDDDPDGIAYDVNTIQLNGGSMLDSAGESAARDFSGVAPGLAGVNTDGTRPQDPASTSGKTISAANDGSYTVSVSFPAAPDAGTVRVRLTGPSGSTVTGSAPANTGGKTTSVTGIDATGLADGEVTIAAKIVDDAGNRNPAGFTASSTVSKDTAAPTIEAFSLSNPRARELTVAVTADEQLSTVRIEIRDSDGETVASLTRTHLDETANDDGTFTYRTTITAVVDGRYEATLSTAADAAGNDGAAGQTDAVRIDSGGSTGQGAEGTPQPSTPSPTPGPTSTATPTETQPPTETPLPATRVENTVKRPDVDVSPRALQFGNVGAGETATLTITVENRVTSTSDFAVSSTAITGRNPGAFSVVGGAAPFVLAPGERRTIEVAFSPTSPGRKEAQLQLPSADDRSQIDVWLTNRGSYVVVQEVAGDTPDERVIVRIDAVDMEPDRHLSVNVSRPRLRSRPASVDTVGMTVEPGGNFTVNVTHSERPVADGETFSEEGIAALQYVHLDYSLPGVSFRNTTLFLRVDAGELPADARPDAVRVYRYADGSWNEQNTTLVRRSATELVFEVDADGFSQFVVTAPTVAQASATPTPEHRGDSDLGGWWWPLVGLVALALLLVLLVTRLRDDGESGPASMDHR